jgi:hypothetical protein
MSYIEVSSEKILDWSDSVIQRIRKSRSARWVTTIEHFHAKRARWHRLFGWLGLFKPLSDEDAKEVIMVRTFATPDIHGWGPYDTATRLKGMALLNLKGTVRLSSKDYEEMRH